MPLRGGEALPDQVDLRSPSGASLCPSSTSSETREGRRSCRGIRFRPAAAV